MKRNTVNLSLIFVLVLLGPVAGVRADVPRPAPCHQPPDTLLDLQDNIPPRIDSRGFDARSYDLDLHLDPGTSRLTGRVGIGMVALEAGLTEVHLDLVDGMACAEVLRGTQPVTFLHGGDSLLVTLDPALSMAEPETLWVRYEGRPLPHGSFRAGLLFRHHNAGTVSDPSDDVPAIANVSETWSAHSWWPCKDHPADKALVSLSATVPDTLLLVSNGTLLGVEAAEPGWTRYRWRESFPMPTYLVSLAASNYVSWRQDCAVSDALGGSAVIDLGFHVFPYDAQDAQVDLAVTCASMEFLTDLLGPYPFSGEKYDQAEIKWGGAMEHPTACSMPTYMFTGEGNYDLLVVHEMAHQWFGNSLTPAAWADIWLNEGFARYCEALWLEHALGRETYAEYMGQIGQGHHPNLFVGDGLLGDPAPILPNILVYDKGAWLLHALRLLMGDEAFFGLLRDYANDPALYHGNTVSTEFQVRAEMAAGRSLDRFFQFWLHTEAVTELASSIEVNAGGESGRVRIDLQQMQEPWVEMAVPGVLHCPGGETEFTLVMDRRSQSFDLSVDCPVDSVSLDPEGLVLMRRAGSPVPVLEVLRHWPNPSSVEGASLAIRLLESADLDVCLYDARGRLVQRTSTGILPATGPDGDPVLWAWHPPQAPSIAAGIYWLELRGLGQRVVRKMTYVK